MTYQRQPESSDEDALWRQRARQELIQALNPPLSAGGLIRLHSRYKYALMAYSPQLYKAADGCCHRQENFPGGTGGNGGGLAAGAAYRIFTACDPRQYDQCTDAYAGLFQTFTEPAEKQQMSAAIEEYRTGPALRKR